MRLVTFLVAVASLANLSACRWGASAEHPGAGPTQVELVRASPRFGTASPTMRLLEREMKRNLARLRSDEAEPPAYFLAYQLIDKNELWIEAREGALFKDHRDRDRSVDVDLRVGSPELDNSHNHDGNYGGRGLGGGVPIPIEDDALSLAQGLWLATERQYRDAVEALHEAENAESLRSREESPADDFSREEALQHIEAPASLDLEALRSEWSRRVKIFSQELGDADFVYESAAVLQATNEQRLTVNSEGSRVQSGGTRLRLMFQVTTQAEDGMELERFRSFEVHDPEQFPSEAELRVAARTLRKELGVLREAPIAEPYTGPAVLEGPAAGVFFHEIFGHRLEGHRQKDDREGQTFSDRLGRPVLPDFLDIVDDPTVASIDGVPLSGHYFVDDEAIRSQRTVLVEKGRLKSFLLGRSPVHPFTHSNGHGRRERGNPTLSRQGNLIVSARRTVPEAQMRDALIDEAKRQGKPYGLWFSDIQGGYTITDRSGPQAFKVLPLMVYRVWTDGRPDELVRGVDIVGTPLAAFETIAAASDRVGIFNGVCGAESGWVPVSAVSPSLLLGQLEVERAAHDRQRPPLLPSPARGSAGENAEKKEGSADVSGGDR